jgi:hypothetical protein
MVGVLSAASLAAEHSWRDFKDVSNSSFVEASGDRAIQLSVDVAAPAHEVFAAFARRAKDFSSWAVPVAHVELRVGGIHRGELRRECQARRSRQHPQ